MRHLSLVGVDFVFDSEGLVNLARTNINCRCELSRSIVRDTQIVVWCHGWKYLKEMLARIVSNGGGIDEKLALL